MVALTIPPQHRGGLATLLRLDPSEFPNMLAALTESPPTLSPTALGTSVQSMVSGVSQDSVKQFVETLLSLYALRAQLELDISEFVDGIVDAMERSKSSNLRFTTKEPAVFREELSQLLDIPSLTLETKALELFRDQENVFHGARVLTDIRPVFAGPATDLPTAALTMHTLRITYHQMDQLRDFFVSIDAEAIKYLVQLLQRAEEKEGSVHRLLEASKIQHIAVS